MLHPYEKACRSHEEWSLYKDEFEAKLKSGDKQALIAQKRYNEKLKKRKEKEMAEKNIIFAKGLRADEKFLNVDYKIIKLGIKYEEFTEFIAKYINDKGYVNIDLKPSKKGGWYAEINTYGLNLDNDNVMKFEDTEDVPF